MKKCIKKSKVRVRRPLPEARKKNSNVQCILKRLRPVQGFLSFKCSTCAVLRTTSSMYRLSSVHGFLSFKCGTYAVLQLVQCTG